MASALAHDLKAHERTSDVDLKDVVPFKKMALSRYVQRGLESSCFVYPTIVQATAIPLAISGVDLLVQSKSGTGKTLIFTIAALQIYGKGSAPNILIVAPTREIAVQIEDTLNGIGKHCHDFKAVSCIGGLDVTGDRKRLQGAKAVVGTPGRLLHIIKNNILNTSEINLFVLDEADKLYAESFREDVQRIQSALPPERQTIACSATFPDNLDKELAKTMYKPLLISNRDRASLLVGIRQFVLEVPTCKNSMLEIRAKINAVRTIFEQLSFKQCLIFASTQTRADSYCNYLQKEGWPCELISGAQDQGTRLTNFRKFRKCETRIMVTTDLMARGVDSEHVNLVINLELPGDVITYLHRIGRAGRFGAHGLAINVIDDKQHTQFRCLLSGIGSPMNVYTFPQTLQQDTDFWNFNIYEFPLFLEAKQQNLPEVVPPNESSAETTINTQTYCVDINKNECIAAANEEEIKEGTYLAAESLQSSTQQPGMCNTIDDASSIKSDSSHLPGNIISDNGNEPEEVEQQPKLAPVKNTKSQQPETQSINEVEISSKPAEKEDHADLLEAELQPAVTELLATTNTLNGEEASNEVLTFSDYNENSENMKITTEFINVDKCDEPILDSTQDDLSTKLNAEIPSNARLTIAEFNKMLGDLLIEILNVNEEKVCEDNGKNPNKLLNFNYELSASDLADLKQQFEIVRREEAARKVSFIDAHSKLMNKNYGNDLYCKFDKYIHDLHNDTNAYDRLDEYEISELSKDAKSFELSEETKNVLMCLKIETKADLMKIILIKQAEMSSRDKQECGSTNSITVEESDVIALASRKAELYRQINERLVEPINLYGIFDGCEERKLFPSPVQTYKCAIPNNATSLPFAAKTTGQLTLNVGPQIEIAPQLSPASPEIATLSDNDENVEPSSGDSQSASDIQTPTASSGFDEHTSSVSSGIETSHRETGSSDNDTTTTTNSSYPSTTEFENDYDDDNETSEDGDDESELDSNGDLNSSNGNIKKIISTEFVEEDSTTEEGEVNFDGSSQNICDGIITPNTITAQEYSEAYARWIDIYWSQRNYVQEYVKLSHNF